MAAPKIAIVAGRRNSSLFRSSAPVRIPQSACSCVVGGSGQESGMRPGGRIAVARTGRALPIARSLSSNTRSVLAGRCACTYSHSVPVTEHWGRSGGTQVWRCIPAAAHRFRTLPPAPRNGDPPPMVKGFWRGGNPAGAIGQLEAPDRFWQRHFCHQDAFLIPDRFQQLHNYMRIGEFEPEHRTEECHSSTPPRSRFSALPLIRPAFAAARSIS